LEKLSNFDSFLNEKKIVFGTTDDFDKLNDKQQHFVLIVLGMLQYNKHLTTMVKKDDDGTAILTVGGRGVEWKTEEDENSSQLITRALEFIKNDKKLMDSIEYKAGTRTIKIKK
jgi:hypothetical protein